MSGMTGGDITTLTGNAGGLIPSSGSGNFNIVGSGGVTVTGTPATHTLTITAAVVPAITNHALAVGTGATITSLALGTNGTVLTGVTGADPAFSASPTLTSVLATTFDTNVAAAAVTLSGTTLSADGTDADININITAKGTGKVIIDDLQLTTDLAVTEGGTGVSTLLDHGLLVGSGTAAIDSIGVGATGTVLVGNTTADPSFSANPTVSTIYATTFDTNVVAAATTLTGTTWAADGTDANIGLTLTPKGTGDVTVTLGDVVLSSGNLNIPNSTSTIGQIQQNGAHVLHNFGQQNFFLGGSGNFTMNNEAFNNLGIGSNSLLSLVGSAPFIGSYNIAVGMSALQAGTDIAFNCSLGFMNAMHLQTGKYNCTYGSYAGTNYTTSESSNILIGYDVNGTVGESHKLRIGKATGTGDGELNAAYIAGIYNTAVGATAGVVLADSSNQLGGLAGSAGQVLQGGTKPAFSTTTYPSTTAKGDVLVASANNVVGVVNDVVNAGYVLTANAAAAPTFQALPAPVVGSFASDAETIAGAVTNKAVAPSNLAAKLGSQTLHALPIGAGSTAALNWLAVGATGETLMGSTGADCGWTSSPQFGGSVTATNDITSTAGSISSLSGSMISRDATNTSTGPSAYFQKVRVAATIQSGDELGKMRFTGYDGTGYITGAKITSTNSGTVATNRIAGDLQFYTHPDASVALPSEPTLRMTIASTGAVTIANPDSGTGLTVSGSGITCTSGAITASSGDVVISSGNLTLHDTTSTIGQITIGGSPVFHTYGGEPGNDAWRNLWVGKDAGNFTCSTAVNYGGNIGIGCLALRSLSNGQENFALGYKAFYALGGTADSGYRNVAIGNYAGYQITCNSGVVDQGAYNTLIGYAAGGYLNASEYSNIFINYQGVAGQNNRLQLGQTTGSGAGYGKINEAYICGIYGRTPAGTLNVALVDSNNQLGSVASLGVAQGGTGAATLTDHGILLGSGTGAITPLGSATNGQLPIGSSGADPVLATISAGTGISVTNGAGTISIAATGTILAWAEETGATKTIVVQEAYVANRGTLITFTLPATAALGTEFKIQGKGAGGWKIAQNSGQTIHVGSSASTTGAAGYIASTDTYDAITLVCITADTDWAAESIVGNITIA